MATTILTRRLDDLIATLSDLGRYLRDTEDQRNDADRRELEGYTADALLRAVEARRDLDAAPA